ncbi:hypothetical protein EYF80_023920 [Liparis tanakae]|uniref:Uncharacterized protein n=1 Tax=Liparis tanakae TaxID=230148 RepID=A0A4Z2HK02_9TELE|nr:hypothetical protein EYF80_023920 [Liparis tanakae]
MKEEWKKKKKKKKLQFESHYTSESWTLGYTTPPWLLRHAVLCGEWAGCVGVQQLHPTGSELLLHPRTHSLRSKGVEMFHGSRTRYRQRAVE